MGAQRGTGSRARERGLGGGGECPALDSSLRNREAVKVFGQRSFAPAAPATAPAGPPPLPGGVWVASGDGGEVAVGISRPPGYAPVSILCPVSQTIFPRKLFLPLPLETLEAPARPPCQ